MALSIEMPSLVPRPLIPERKKGLVHSVCACVRFASVSPCSIPGLTEVNFARLALIIYGGWKLNISPLPELGFTHYT